MKRKVFDIGLRLTVASVIIADGVVRHVKS